MSGDVTGTGEVPTSRRAPGSDERRLSVASGPPAAGPRPTPRSGRRGILSSGAASSRVVIPLACVVLDLGLIAATIAGAAYLRQQLNVFGSANDLSEAATQAGVPIALGWLVVLGLFGTYRQHQFSAGTDEYKNVVNSSVITAGLVGIGCYLFKFPLSRGFFVLTFVIGVPLLVLGRFVLRRALHAARRRGLFRHRVLVAGDGPHIDELTTIMNRESWLGYRVVGALRADGARPEERTRLGVPYVGDAGAAAEAVLRTRADVMVVAGGAFASSLEVRRAQWALEGEHVQVIVVPSVTDVAGERIRVRPVAGLPLVHLEQPKGVEALRWAKRAFDVVGASLALIVATPVMLVAALLVKLGDGGPVLFRQVRVGRDGEQFAMLKFRSMVVGAETMLPALRPANESDGVLFKLAEDPRVTRHGRWMRRFSLDELPQLYNVLAGEMSLVGPRPALPAEVSRYDADVSRRLRVRPGITGLWQVSGRSDLSWEDTVRLDLYYVDNWSMVQDLTILARTMLAVLRRDGAY